LVLAICIYAPIYLSGTISQAEEKHHGLWPLDSNHTETEEQR
jgi:hypothetical protein